MATRQRLPKRRACVLRSPNQLTRILESLAVVGPYTFFPFERTLLEEQQGTPAGATQIVVASLLTPGLEDALRLLRQRGRRVVLVMVGDDAPGLERLPFPVYHVPPHLAPFADAEHAMEGHAEVTAQ